MAFRHKYDDFNLGQGHFQNFKGDVNEYEKYYEKGGKLKEGYSTSGDIGGSEKVYGHTVQGAINKHPNSGTTRDPSRKFEIYKLPEQKATTTPAPTPEPEAPAPEPKKDKEPVIQSPEIADAKERVANYKQQSIDGNAGSDYSTEASTAGTNGISFEPAKIDTPAYDPDAGKEAQGFADKYKLSLLNKGNTAQSDFSGV